jgi:hypothetical protein
VKPRRALAGALISLFLVAPGAAHAAWTPPESIAGATPWAEVAGLRIDAGGRAIAYWRDDVDTPYGPAELVSAVRTPGAPWAAGPKLHESSFDRPGGQPFGRSGIAVTQYQSTPKPVGLPVSIFDITGHRQRRFVLDRGHPVDSAAFAASPGGRTVAVWDRVRKYRARGPVMFARAYGRPQRVSRPQRVNGNWAAVNDRGDALIAWLVEHGRYPNYELSLRARIRRADGTLTPTVTLGGARGFDPSLAPSLAIAPDGRAAIAWSAAKHAEFGEMLPAYVAELGREGRVRSRHRLTPRSAIAKGYGSTAAAAVVATADGELVTAWTDGKPYFYTVHTATLRRGRLSDVQLLSDPARDGHLTHLHAEPDGTVRVLWTTDWDESRENEDHDDPFDYERRQPVELTTAERAPGGRFRGPERISSDTDRRPIPESFLSFDPHNRRPVAVWIDGVESDSELRTATGY